MLLQFPELLHKSLIRSDGGPAVLDQPVGVLIGEVVVVHQIADNYCGRPADLNTINIYT